MNHRLKSYAQDLGLLALGLFAVLAVQATEAPGETGHKEKEAEHHEEGNPLELDAASLQQLGIETEVLEPRLLAEEIKAPGEVQRNAYTTALVSPRIPALVVRRQAKLGDTVQAGQILATVSSVELAEAQGALLIAEREWQRVQTLGRDAVSGRRHLEAQVARDQAQAKARAYGMSDSQIAQLLKAGSAGAQGEFDLLAPRSGRITSDDFLVGERVEAGRTLFTLVDEASVWVIAQLAPATVERLQPGASARIEVHGQSHTGTVLQLAHRTEEDTRTSPVRIELANPKDSLHPGEFVEVFLSTTDAKTQLAVPTEALMQLEGQTVVFRAEDEPGHFETAPVVAGETRGALTVLREGVSAGDTVVVKGAYALKARLLKSKLGEGHAH